MRSKEAPAEDGEAVAPTAEAPDGEAPVAPAESSAGEKYPKTVIDGSSNPQPVPEVTRSGNATS